MFWIVIFRYYLEQGTKTALIIISSFRTFNTDTHSTPPWIIFSPSAKDVEAIIKNP